MYINENKVYWNKVSHQTEMIHGQLGQFKTIMEEGLPTHHSYSELIFCVSDDKCQPNISLYTCILTYKNYISLMQLDI